MVKSYCRVNNTLQVSFVNEQTREATLPVSDIRLIAVRLRQQ
jgi:hypothetical protein